MVSDAAPQQHEQSPSSEGLDPKIGGLLAYFTWIGGLIMLLTQKHPEVKFHGAQSILLNIAVFAALIATGLLQLIGGLIFWALGLIFSIVYVLVGIGAVVLWIILAIKGYNLVHYRLPIVGKIAEGWAAR